MLKRSRHEFQRQTRVSSAAGVAGVAAAAAGVVAAGAAEALDCEVAVVAVVEVEGAGVVLELSPEEVFGLLLSLAGVVVVAADDMAGGRVRACVLACVYSHSLAGTGWATTGRVAIPHLAGRVWGRADGSGLAKSAKTNDTWKKVGPSRRAGQGSLIQNGTAEVGASSQHGEGRARMGLFCFFLERRKRGGFRDGQQDFGGERNSSLARGRVVAPYYGHWISTSWATAWPGSLGGLGEAWQGRTCLALIGRWGGGRGPEVDLMKATRGAAYSRWWTRYLASVLPALPRETKSPPRPQRLLDRGIACPGLPSSGGLRLSVCRMSSRVDQVARNGGWPFSHLLIEHVAFVISKGKVARRVSPGPSSSSQAGWLAALCFTHTTMTMASLPAWPA